MGGGGRGGGWWAFWRGWLCRLWVLGRVGGGGVVCMYVWMDLI